MADVMNNVDTVTEEMPEEFWLMILFSLLTDIPSIEWNEFADDLIYKNRGSITKLVGFRVPDIVPPAHVK